MTLAPLALSSHCQPAAIALLPDYQLFAKLFSIIIFDSSHNVFTYKRVSLIKKCTNFYIIAIILRNNYKSRIYVIEKWFMKDIILFGRGFCWKIIILYHKLDNWIEGSMMWAYVTRMLSFNDAKKTRLWNLRWNLRKQDSLSLSLQYYIIFALLRERTEFLLSRHEPVSNRWRMNQDAYIRIRKSTSSS